MQPPIFRNFFGAPCSAPREGACGYNGGMHLGKRLAVLLAAASAAIGGADPRRVDQAQESITVQELADEVALLTDDRFRGRAVGTPENEAVADHLAKAFAAMGMQPAGEDGSFLQYTNLVRAQLGDDNGLEISSLYVKTPRLAFRTDYVPAHLSAGGRATGPAVFAGYGLSLPGYDDYQGVDVRGAVAVVMTGRPREESSDDRFADELWERGTAELHKLRAAQVRGAIGVLFIDLQSANFPLTARLDWPEDPSLQRYWLKEDARQVSIPAMYASDASVEEVLHAFALDLDEVRRRIDADFRPQSRALPGLRITLETDVKSEELRAPNVLAMLPGADESLRGQYIVVGAHFDHVGVHGSSIFRGADDDASGTAALLEIAEAFAESPQRPRRSLLFAAFNAEEKGLLGSRHFVHRPTVPLANIEAMLQMDMIGRNEEVPDPSEPRFLGLEVQSASENRNAVNVLGYSRHPELSRLVARVNRRVLLQIHFRYDDHPINLLKRSDQWSFLQRGIPALLFTTGFHPDYHRPSDTPDKLNLKKMRRVAELVCRAAWELADGE